MKKYLSFFFAAILATTLMFSAASCSKDDVDPKIVGTWEVISGSGPLEEVVNVYWQFKQDGTFIDVIIEGNDVDASLGKWSLSGNTLSLTPVIVNEDAFPMTFTVYNLTKDSLTIAWGAGEIFTLTFKRVSDSTIEKYL